jgi:RNA polymerase sigma factor (sigma-70 family)
MHDNRLLREYAEHQSQTAFAEFVGRHLNVVYAAALRQVGGDTHLAGDVAQQVFIAAAQKARTLAAHPAPVAWLFTSTHHAAAALMRGRRRRQHRETEASLMEEAVPTDAAVDWRQLGPALDEALLDLNERERSALVLRYLDQRSMVEVSSRLGLSERGARKLLDRALDRLRRRLARRGITSTAAALAVVLEGGTAAAAPAGLAASISTAAVASKAVPAWGLTLSHLMSSSKMITASAALVLGVGIGTGLGAYTAPAEIVVARPMRPPPKRPQAKIAAPPVAPAMPVLTRAGDVSDMLESGLLSGLSFSPQVAPDKRWSVVATTLQEILDLSAEQTAALEAAFVQSRQAVFGQIAAAAAVVPGEPGKITIKLGDLTQAREEAVQLHAVVRQLLGDDRRYAIYENLGFKSSIENLFRYAGLYATTVTVAKHPTSKDSFRVLYMPGLTMADRPDLMDTNVIPQVMEPLAHLIPGEF